MIRVRQVKVPITDNNEQTIILKIATKLNVSIKKIKNYNITKKSIDARDKKNIFYVYEFDVLVENENDILRKNKSKDILKTPEESYKFLITGTLKMKHKPVIVGSGPAGLFCAYLLAENGYNPIITPTRAPAAIKRIGCLLILFVITYKTINKRAALKSKKSAQ